MKTIIKNRIETIKNKRRVLEELEQEQELRPEQELEIYKLNEKLEELDEDIERLEEIDSNNTHMDEELIIAIEDWGLYNQGFLACKWWDYNSDIEDIQDFYKLARKYHDIDEVDDVELFIADNNGLSYINEHTNIDDAIDMLNQVYLLDDADKEKVNFLIEELGQDFDDALYNYEEVIIYENMNMEDVAYEYIDSCYNLEKEMGHLARYFDYEAFGRDLELDGNFTVVGSDIYEYRN